MAMSRSIGGSSLTTLSPISDLARGDRFQPGHHAQRRRLAAAGRADQHHELLVADLEVHVLDGVNLVVLLVQAPDQDLGHRFIPLTEPVRPAT